MRRDFPEIYRHAITSGLRVTAFTNAPWSRTRSQISSTGIAPWPSRSRSTHDGRDLRPGGLRSRLLRALPARHRSPPGRRIRLKLKTMASPGTSTRSRPCARSRARRDASPARGISTPARLRGQPHRRAAPHSRPGGRPRTSIDRSSRLARKEAADEACGRRPQRARDEQVSPAAPAATPSPSIPTGPCSSASSRRNGYDVKEGTFDRVGNEHCPSCAPAPGSPTTSAAAAADLPLRELRGASELEHGDAETIVAHFCEVTHSHLRSLRERGRPCRGRDLLPGRGRPGSAGRLAGQRARCSRRGGRLRSASDAAPPHRAASSRSAGVPPEPSDARSPRGSRLRLRVGGVTLHFIPRRDSPSAFRRDDGLPHHTREATSTSGRARPHPPPSSEPCSYPGACGRSTPGPAAPVSIREPVRGRAPLAALVIDETRSTRPSSSARGGVLRAALPAGRAALPAPSGPTRRDGGPCRGRGLEGRALLSVASPAGEDHGGAAVAASSPPAEVLSDDRMIVRPRGGRLWAFGTPWHGSGRFASPRGLHSGGVYFLARGRRSAWAAMARPRPRPRSTRGRFHLPGKRRGARASSLCARASRTRYRAGGCASGRTTPRSRP